MAAKTGHAAKAKRVKLPGDVAQALAASKPANRPVDMMAFIDNARNARLMQELKKAFI